MPKLSDFEVKEGKRVEPLKFGDLIFREEISDLSITPSGLVYGYTANRDIVWTELAPARARQA